jgi:hypothetical protein
MTAEPAPASEGEGEVDDPGFRHVGVEIICTPDVADAIAQQLRDAVEEIRASYSDAARGMWDAGSG